MPYNGNESSMPLPSVDKAAFKKKKKKGSLWHQATDRALSVGFMCCFLGLLSLTDAHEISHTALLHTCGSLCWSEAAGQHLNPEAGPLKKDQ